MFKGVLAMFQRRVEPEHEEYFDDIENAREYAKHAEKSLIRYRAFLKHLQRFEIKGKYLEVGAGPGILAAVVAKENPDVEITTVERSSAMMTVGRDYVKSKGLQNRIQYVLGDVNDEVLLQKLGNFDVIYCTALHHWDNPEKVIRNLLDVLLDDGFLILYDLKRVGWLYWVPIHNGFFNSIRAAYTASEIRAILKRLNIDHFEIKNEFPFMHSIFIKRRY